MSSATHRGAREDNEDAVGCDIGTGLAVVADGLGGHGSGEVASACAVEALRDFIRLVERTRQPTDAHDPVELMRKGIDVAQRAVAGRAAQSNVDMMTTVVAAWFLHGSVIVAHVGDSRLYRLRAGTLECLTADHTVFQEAGRGAAFHSDEERRVATERFRGMLTRALGMPQDIEADLRREAVQSGDVYLLCTDGLWGAISHEALAVALLRDAPAYDIAEKLVSAARGGDNATAAVVRVMTTGA